MVLDILLAVMWAYLLYRTAWWVAHYWEYHWHADKPDPHAGAMEEFRLELWKLERDLWL